jgi:HSP20 family protein
MTLVKQNPRVFNNLFDDFFFSFPTAWGRDAHIHNLQVPPVNIHETTDGYHVELSAPGLTKENFKVNVENNLLTISFEKQEQNETKEFKTIRREFSTKSFKRSFTLDDKVNADDIQAKYENGLLLLYIPKKEEVKVAPKQITIN